VTRGYHRMQQAVPRSLLCVSGSLLRVSRSLITDCSKRFLRTLLAPRAGIYLPKPETLNRPWPNQSRHLFSKRPLYSDLISDIPKTDPFE
jgi:hypothetical protein